MVLIGIDIIGMNTFDSFIPSANIYRLDIQKGIYDEVHVQTGINNVTSKGSWTNSTVLLAQFQDTLEAGNIQMRENPIMKLRLKRRNVKKSLSTIVKEFPFVSNDDVFEYEDYCPISNEQYEYLVTPVDASGIEGIVNTVSIKPVFEGWWLIDLDNPEENKFRFLYNLDNVSSTLLEDRVQMTTFSKYPIVRYGQNRARTGTLSGLFINEGLSVVDQYKNLDSLLELHKPLLLKDSVGRAYMVDVSTPTENAYQKPTGVSQISVKWVEVGAYSD